MEDHKKMFCIQIPIEVKVEMVKPHFKVDTKAHTVNIINMKINLNMVDMETF